MILSKNIMLMGLILAVILSGILIVLANLQSTHIHQSKNPLNAFMTSVTAVRMDKNGFPRSTLTAPDFQYYYKQNRLLIKQPVLHITPNQTLLGAWRISANNALARLTAKTITLLGNVDIIRHKTKALPTTHFKTTRLLINTETGKAYTHQPVKIIQHNNTVSSKGLTANLNTGNINLTSSASGEFDPSKDSL